MLAGNDGEGGWTLAAAGVVNLARGGWTLAAAGVVDLERGDGARGRVAWCRWMRNHPEYLHSMRNAV